MQFQHLVSAFLLLVACGGSHRPGTTMDAMSLESAGDSDDRAMISTGAIAPRSTSTASSMAAQEALVIRGFITARVDDVRITSEAIAHQVRSAGGRVIRERGNGAHEDWNSFMSVRLPPEGVDSLISWLGTHGDIESKRIEAEDVSKTLFDQELELANLHKTLVRMQALLDRPDLNIEAVLKIEQEMSRVRGRIEAVKGAQRFLKDRVAFATIDFTLRRRDGVNWDPETKFLAGLRMTGLSLLDPAGRTRHRMGIGLVLRAPKTKMSWEVDLFAAEGDGKRAMIATVGGIVYSDHLGGGRRRFLNPYTGLRLGYGQLDGSNFVGAAEVGLELFKHERAVLDLNVRGTGFFGKGGGDYALVTAAGLSVAF